MFSTHSRVPVLGSSLLKSFRRHLNLQEHQSKDLMRQHGLKVQNFRVISESGEAEAALSDLRAAEVVIKAQILAGGRGKGRFSSGIQGGGVQLTKDAAAVKRIVGGMLGHHLVTHQTGPEGVLVEEVMLAEAKNLVRETYVAVLLDRKSGGACLVVSEMGGMDIEEVAARNPEKILKIPLNFVKAQSSKQTEILLQAARFLFPEAEASVHQQTIDQLSRLVEMFHQLDATMIEVNPFGLTDSGEVLCFDAKLEFDENAAFRQQRLFQKSASAATEPTSETLARSHGLNYIQMTGNVGCLVNGAGLAMATMDLIKLHGGDPANFLDVGGGASATQIQTALQILFDNPQVSSILINIFGGIMRCDVIAAGVIAAVNNLKTTSAVNAKPLVVRLAGTNSALGMKMLRESGISMVVCEDAEEAAKMAISKAVLHPQRKACGSH